MKEVRYFFVPQANETNSLPDDEVLHAARVLRLTEGSQVVLMDGEGTFYEAELTLVSPKRCQYRILQTLPQQRPWQQRITLAIAPTKMMERIEWLAEKATEVGFDEMVLLDCKFSERHIVKTPRLDKIIVAATKQSRKPWKPIVHDMQDFARFVTAPRPGKKFICHCYDEFERQELFPLLCAAAKTDPQQDLTVLVGPEGDFSVDEVQLAIDNGYQSVSLGTSRLRTETAGLMAVTMMQLSKIG